MTWKEPLLARQHRIKESLAVLQARNLLKGLLAILLLATIVIIVKSPPKTSLGQEIRFGVAFFLMFLMMFFVCWGGQLLANYFEATYSLNQKGLQIKRAGLLKFLPWWQISHLKIVPHPTLENIALIRIHQNGLIRIVLPQRLENMTLFRNLTRFIDIPYAEIPFELGQIDPAAVLELYQKHGRKKRGR